jgi:hypothetical protein
MGRDGLTADQAFGVLTRISQETNRKLFDIARELTDTRAVPRRNVRRDRPVPCGRAVGARGWRVAAPPVAVVDVELI